MKIHNLFTQKNHHKIADKAQKMRSVSVNEHWLDDIDEQQKSGVRMNSSELQALSRKGLWGLLIFLLISIAAFLVKDFNLYESFSEPILQILGSPPPAILIHLAIICYSFTIFVPVMIRMANEDNPTIGWSHLFYRSVFYLFYLVSTTLPENFVPILCIGVFLYIVEQVGIWAALYRYQREAENLG